MSLKWTLQYVVLLFRVISAVHIYNKFCVMYACNSVGYLSYLCKLQHSAHPELFSMDSGYYSENTILYVDV